MSLKSIREAKKFSQSSLASKTGVPLKTIQKYESGERDINKAQGITLYRLAKVLDCNIEDLLENLEDINIMMSLEEKIDRTIDNAAMRTGKMGTETVRVSLQLTDEEVEQFKSITKYDNDHYYYEIDGNNLYIDYTEEV